MTRHRFFALLIAVLVFIAYCQNSAIVALAKETADEPFHIAQSIPEKMLDSIIRRSERGLMAKDILTGHITNEASNSFTKNLLASFILVETKTVQHDCGGQYTAGDICGIDENPVSCGQDFIDMDYLYQTLESGPQKAIIAFQWPGNAGQSKKHLYRIVKTGGRWKLDGIDCGDGLRFNMDQR